MITIQIANIAHLNLTYQHNHNKLTVAHTNTRNRNLALPIQIHRFTYVHICQECKCATNDRQNANICVCMLARTLPVCSSPHTQHMCAHVKHKQTIIVAPSMRGSRITDTSALSRGATTMCGAIFCAVAAAAAVAAAVLRCAQVRSMLISCFRAVTPIGIAAKQAASICVHLCVGVCIK